MPLLEKKLVVEVSGTPSSPSVETAVTNAEKIPVTNLVVMRSAVHLGENRSLGIYRKNFGLVLPGQSKSVSRAPKLPAGTTPAAPAGTPLEKGKELRQQLL